MKSSQEIREILDSLAEKKMQIDAQVSAAKRTFASGGGASDSEWLGRAEYAQRATGRDIQYWQGELGKARRAEKQATSLRLESAFITRARQILRADVFAEIFEMAQADASGEIP